jgi:hypothetical protein
MIIRKCGDRRGIHARSTQEVRRAVCGRLAWRLRRVLILRIRASWLRSRLIRFVIHRGGVCTRAANRYS